MRSPLRKQDFPVEKVRQYLEPGPIVLVTTQWQQQRNIMTLGWHTVLEFSPSLVGLMISRATHSFDPIRRSGECVINLPTVALADTVVRFGNCSGVSVGKYALFDLAPVRASRVRAPLLGRCHANLECRLHDDALVERYNFFVFEVLKAHVAVSPRHPRTLRYTGDGVFMTAGRMISCRSLFRPDMLG